MAIQVFAIAMALFAISRAYLRLREKKLKPFEFIFWTLLWLVVVFIAFAPDVTFFFSKLVGIERGIDIIIYTSIIALFYLMFRLYVKLETVEQNLTKIVRELALREKKR